MVNSRPTIPRFHRLFRSSLLALLPFGAVVVASPAQAQPCPAGKSCYYIPPLLPAPPIAPQNYGGDIVLSANAGSVNGTYSINGAAAVPFSVNAGSPLLIPLTGTSNRMSGFLLPENRGAFVVADSSSFTVTQRVTAAAWQASATIKNDIVGVGTRFRAGS
jgi:hypothetical protein